MEQVLYDQIVRPVVKFLTGHITKHLGYALCSSKHVTCMTKRMKVLEDKKNDLKKKIGTHEVQKKEIPAGVRDWMKAVENLQKELEKTKIEVESFANDGNGCLNMKIRYRAGRKACTATPRIEELITENAEFKWDDARKPMGRLDSKPASSTTCTPSSSSSSGGDGFKSRERPFNNALSYLQDNKTQVIALCGMGGVGKTTLMEQLRIVANDKRMFDFIVKVVIGNQPNMLSIQNDIAQDIAADGLYKLNETSRGDRLVEIFKETLEKQKKSILLILDDMWEIINLKHIGLTSPLPNGLKLLLTSRKSDVCKQISLDAQSVFEEVKVDVLEETEARKFFFQITNISEEGDKMSTIGCEIVKKCGGLPFALNIIGKALRTKEIFDWRITLQRLNKNDNYDNVQEVIKISYDYLKNEDKEVFLLCGLFPEDSDISIENLTRYAFGLNLFKKVSTLRVARDWTKSCVGNLIDAHLLIKSDLPGCVKVHDLGLAFVLGEVSKYDQPWVINHGDVPEWVTDERSKSCKKISLTCMGMSKFPEEFFKYPNLSLLQLMHGDSSLNFPEHFYDNMKNLELIAYYDMKYPLLPRSLQSSTNLKSLCLYGCMLMFDLSFLGDLVNLEVLSLAYCDIRKLPSKIGNLKRLKLLDLTECVDLRIDNGVLKNLTNLEELYMRVSTGKAIRFTDANLEELAVLSRKLYALEVEFFERKIRLENFSFENLDKFMIAIGCHFYEFIEQVQDSLENTLALVSDRSSDLRDGEINKLFKKTEKCFLQVEDMIGLEDVSLDLFHNLTDLEVFGCANLKYLFPAHVANGLKKLERLMISSCSVLEAMVQNDGSEINSIVELPELVELEVEQLPNLKYLFPAHVANGLKKLERLKISSCSVLEALVQNDGSEINSIVELPELVELEVNHLPNFTSIYPDNNNNRALLSSQVKIPKLEKLKIKVMKELGQIFGCELDSSNEEEINNISILREIEVQRCDSLVNLFPTNPMRFLNHLETLEVSYCGSIEQIFNLDLERTGHEVEKLSSSNLRSIEVSDSKNLREVCRIKGVESSSGSSRLIRGFEAVKLIRIENCQMFRNVFTPTNYTTKFDMSALTDIQISNSGFEELKQGDDNISTVAFPSNLYLHYLSTLSLYGYFGVEVVFEIEGPTTGSRDLVTTSNNQQPLPLPNLQSLSLGNMKSMTHVWKCCNWNKFLILEKPSSFHNLTTIRMTECNEIKYLLSPLMAKLLSNLKTIDISLCDGMEEVVSNRDDKDEEMTTYITTTLFPHLHSLRFGYLENLKRIGGSGGGAKRTTSVIHDRSKFSLSGVETWSLCQYSKEIHINYCDSLIEVFETQSVNKKSGDCSITNVDEGSFGTHAILSRENINVTRLSNLKIMKIRSCALLPLVFTFSMLECLKQLEELEIKNCNAMTVIVKDEDGERRKDVEFPRLKFLDLRDLPNLEGFFLGMNDFKWPLLEKVMIDNCSRITKFTCGQSTTPKLNNVYTSLGKHSLDECGLNFTRQTKLASSESSSSCSTSLERLPWSFHNLIEMDMKDENNVKCIIPYNELLKLQKLERIEVHYCRDVEKIFEVEAMEGTNSELQTVVEIPNLTQLKLIKLRGLKYIWKSNHHGRVLKFPNLTTLYVGHCNILKHVFTSSMVGSLLQLQNLHVIDCHHIEVIVKVEKEESELGLFEGTNNGFVEFQNVVEIPNLRQVVLNSLKNLEHIWKRNHQQITTVKFPNLTTLSINNCISLKHVFTSSMVGSLQQLQDLHISKCENMEEVVFKEEEEEEESQSHATVKKIVLPCLKSLKLESLRSLKGFCLGKDGFSLPSLHDLKIWYCPQIMVFTNGQVETQALNEIDTGFGRCHIFNVDINDFIKVNLHEGFEF